MIGHHAGVYPNTSLLLDAGVRPGVMIQLDAMENTMQGNRSSLKSGFFGTPIAKSSLMKTPFTESGFLMTSFAKHGLIS